MRFFRRGNDTARVKQVVASRAIFAHADEMKRIDVRFRNEEGDDLTLELTPDQAARLIIELSTAYEAIRPPLRGMGGGAAGWNGMS